MNSDERGAGTLLVALVGAFVVWLTGVGLLVSMYAVVVHQARGAADLAALAAAHAHATGGNACRTAAVVVRANGAELASCEVTGPPTGFAVSVSAQIGVPTRLPGFPRQVVGSARAGTPRR